MRYDHGEDAAEREILGLFTHFGLHISDGVDSCSGYDMDDMRRAAEKLAGLISTRVTPLEQKVAFLQEKFDHSPDCNASPCVCGYAEVMSGAEQNEWLQSILSTAKERGSEIARLKNALAFIQERAELVLPGEALWDHRRTVGSHGGGPSGEFYHLRLEALDAIVVIAREALK